MSVTAWDFSRAGKIGECPGDAFDNGGIVRPEPGMCKTGSGFLISTNHRF